MNLKPIKKALLVYIAATILEKVLRKKQGEKMWKNAINHARRQLNLELSLIERHFQRDE